MEIKKPKLKWNGTLTPLTKVEKLIQHHMAHPSWDIYDVHKYHRDSNGWIGIGYNYWISFKGEIYEGRGFHQGAHAGSNWNGRSLGIGYQGNFQEQKMPNEQLEAGAWLNAKFIKEHGLSVNDIIGHRDASNTLCPGNNFRMTELKKRTEEILAGDTGDSGNDNGDGTIYRVQIGAFSSYENAENHAAKAQSDGYDTYIGMRGNLYVVQIGAFSNKKNANALAKKADTDGYDTFISTEDLKPAKKPDKEPENGTEEGDKEEIEGKTPIIGKPQATVNQAKEWARNREALELFLNKADTFWHYGEVTGIRPEVAYALSARETAFKHHGGVIDISFHNWGGIKTKDGGPDNDPDAHERFDTDDDGIRAVFNHMCAYVGKEPVGEPHGRYHTVMSTDWAGTIKTVEEMGHRWATDKNYGQTLVENYLEELLATKEPKETEEPQKPGTNIWEEVINLLKALLEALLKLIRDK